MASGGRRPFGQVAFVVLFVVVQMAVSLDGMAQTISLRSPTVQRGASTLTTALIRASDTVTLKWDRNIPASRLKIGTRPGEYVFRNVPLPAGREATFTPEVVGLPVGVYHGVITTSSANTLVEIQLDASTDNSIEYSAEFQFVVESQTTPRIVGPRSQVASRTPLFEWEPVSGVPAYALVLSSAPFTIGSNPSTGELSIEGINLTWALLTTGTSALYGEKATANPVISFEAQPLVPGRTYYYTILNAYSTTDTSLLSPVTGTIVSFSIQDTGGLPAAELISPRGNVLFQDPEVIDLQWNAVPGATSYDVSVFERQVTGSTTADVLVFSERTTDRRVAMPARQTLRSGRHSWFVIANDGNGAGSVSETAFFRNKVPMGTFTFRTSSGPERSDLLGVTVTVRSTDGGYSPPNPLVNATSLSYSDSLRAGRYVFQAQKVGFADSSFAVQIRTGAQTDVDINLRQLSARVSGRVVDEGGQPLSGVRIAARHVATSLVRTTLTTLDGGFSLALAPGTYEFTATREGYRPSTPIVLTLSRNAFIVLPQPIPLVEDNIPVSGRVLTSTGSPVALADVSARSGTQRIVTTTNADGVYTMSLSEGEWTLEATRQGLLSSGFRKLTVARGDVVSNFDFILGSASASLSGTVLVQSVDTDGAIVQTPLEGGLVKAVPASGTVVQTATDSKGRFSMDVSEGGYSLMVEKEGVVPGRRLDLHVRTGDRVADILLMVDRATAVVEGRVISTSGQGLTDLTVVSSSGAHTRTTSGGGFRLQTDPGPQVLRVEGHSRFLPRTLHVSLEEDRVARVPDMVLGPNALRLVGHVRSNDGPAAMVPVQAVAAADTFRTVSLSDGAFALALPPGQWELRAASPLYGTSEAVVVNGAGGQTISDLRLALPGQVRIFSGHVLSGPRPVMLASVRVATPHGTLQTQSRSDGFFSMLVPDGKDLQAETLADGFLRDVRLVSLASTAKEVIDLVPHAAVLGGRVVDRSGRGVRDATIRISSTTRPDTVIVPDGLGEFRVGLPPGSLDIEVDGPGWLQASRSVDLEAGQTRTIAPIVLTRTDGSLIVDIRTDDNEPFDGARIRAVGHTTRERTTASNGQASIGGLAAGTWSVTVEAAGYRTETGQVTVQAGEASEISFVMSPHAGSVGGRVTGTDGTPVRGATVTLDQGTERFLTETDADGTFGLASVPPGSWTLHVFRDGYATFTEAAIQVDSTGVDRSIVLTPFSGSLAALVIDASSSDGVWNAQVEVRSSLGMSTALSGADGRVQLGGLPDGPAVIRTTHPSYNAAEQQVTIPIQDEAQITAVLRPLQAGLTGRVVSDAGTPLPFSTTVVVETATTRREVQTDADGAWAVDRLPEAVPIRVLTRTGRPGYTDASLTLTIPPGTVQVPVADLVVQQRNATISGFVQLEEVTVDVANGRLEARTLSLSDGSFRLDGLPAGTWRVVPSKPGYTFTPTERTVETGRSGTVSASFVPASDIAAVEIRIRDEAGLPIEDVPLSITSLDRRIERQAETGVGGVVTPAGLPGGFVYRVEPAEPLARFEPPSALVDVQTARQATVSFVRVPATARLSGPLRDEAGTTVLNAIVELFDDRGDLVQTLSTGTGLFSLGPVPAGAYVLRIRSSGHLDVERSVVLVAGAEQVLNNIILFRRNVRISGRVLRAGMPVEGQVVALPGIGTAVVRTGMDGRFAIPDVPLGLAGSVVLELVIPRSGQPDVRRNVVVGESDIQTGVVVPDIVLSSGQIRIRATRNGQPLAGLQLAVGGPSLARLDLVTDASGSAATPRRLDAGAYAITTLADTLLRPVPSPDVRIPTDTSTVQMALELPYTHTPVPESVTSIDSLVFRIRGVPRPGDRAYLLMNGQAVGIAMTPDASGWHLERPPPGPAAFTYRLEVADSTGRVAYASPDHERVPQVAGRLATIRLEPDVSGRVLRLGGTYRTLLVVRDETGRDLDSRFLPGLPGASVTWSADGPAVQVQPDPATSGLSSVLVASAIGESQLDVRVRVDGVERHLTVPVEVKDVTVTDVAVNVDRQRVFNDGGRVQFTVAGKASSGEDILLGSGFGIRLEPEGVGTLVGNTLQMNAPDFIGPLTVMVKDNESGLERAVELSAFARVDNRSSMDFRDREDVRFQVPRYAFTEAGELSLRRDAVPAGKRFANGASAVPTAPAVSVADRSVRFLFRSERALIGDSLAVPATLSLSNRSGLRLQEGAGEIVRFDDRNLKWSRLPSEDTGFQVRSDDVTRLGEYAIAVSSRPLAIRHAALLPTPFSPQDGSMRIGYLLESTSPPASVSIYIVNLRGERIRTLLSRTPQWPGRYGSDSGLLRVEWDGRTDSGKWARNGRYLVYIEAEDDSGTAREVLQAVLVK
ncbi:MAG: carboxypeptidase-like regulatory domain-containing protein [Rhodothermales bacterium]